MELYREKKREEGDRGGQKDKRGKSKGERQIQPVISSLSVLQPVHSEGDQPWDFFGRNDAKLKLQYFGHLMRSVDSLEDSDAGRDWGQEEKGTTENEMAGWHH